MLYLYDLNRPLINEIPTAEDYQPDWMRESDRQRRGRLHLT